MAALSPPFQPSSGSSQAQPRYVPVSKSTRPVVTIITPFFNAGKVFQQTRECVLGQSLQQWKWLIVNDASDDYTSLAALATVRRRDPRITVLDQPERRGPSAARNLAARSADTPYLAFLDSDDLLEATALEKMVWCLESHPEWAMCKGHTVAFGEQTYVSRVGFGCSWLFLDRNPITLTAVVRKEAFEAIGGFDEAMKAGLEDWDLWLRLASQGYWGYTIPEVLDWYRRRRTHADRWGLWTRGGVGKVRRRLRRAYPDLYRRGIPIIPEREFDPSESLREDSPFQNLLEPAGRQLWLLPAAEVADQVESLAGVPPEETHNTTIVLLQGQRRDRGDSILGEAAEVFTLSGFLHVADYARFLLYLLDSRDFERVMIWESPLTLPLYPLLRAHYADRVFQRAGPDNIRPLVGALPFEVAEYLPAGGKALETITVSEQEPLATARHLAGNVAAECAKHRDARQVQAHGLSMLQKADGLARLGRLSIFIFLLSERLRTLGGRIRGAFSPGGAKEGRCA